ncbi:ABC transporter ATP-binding protein [Clostridia bacterium]|nr:ABC transporter ATP-binding protein [Clostridia bacterium]
MSGNLLEVKNLAVSFKTEEGLFPAVDDVSFDIAADECIGIVGESGCGKSVTSLAVMRLLKTPPASITGKIYFKDRELLSLNMNDMRKIRGNEIAMIFQEPMTSLNPVFTCGKQIAEVLMLHRGMGKGEAHRKSIELLVKVGIPMPEKQYDSYPHQLSGGMRQRVMIAMALACSPQLLIADEATTALDMTIQAQIMEEIKALRKEMGMSVMLITHDMGIVADAAERVIVMYAGDIVEDADVHIIFKNPMHPYTRGLLASIPRLTGERSELAVIDGVVPLPGEYTHCCRFAPRCTVRTERCMRAKPPLCDAGANHHVRCFLAQESAEVSK